MRIASLAFVLMLASAAKAQIIVDISHGPPYKRTFQTHAGNGDKSITSPQKIADINEKLAVDGNKEAAFQLGLAYLQGLGRKVDLDSATKWLTMGATTPDEKALLAALYRNGEYFPKNPALAEKWAISAGRSGDIFELAQQYRQSSPPQMERAVNLYRQLLEMRDRPEFRRAQMELGNLVLDGRYSAGEDEIARALNLEWARVIAQELLGQQEYTMAVAFDAEVDGVPHDQAMWERYCKRAAAYNVDLAQEFYGKAILEKHVSGAKPLEGYAWIRLSADKRYVNRSVVKAMDAQMSPEMKQAADSLFEGMIVTRKRDGAYYAARDVLREPSSTELEAMPKDDPDVQLRRAFALESSKEPGSYEAAMDIYRQVRNRGGTDAKLVLATEYEQGTDGVQKNERLARYWRSNALDGPEKARAILGKR